MSMSENEMAIEEISLIPSGTFVVQGHFAVESAEMLILLRNEVGEHLLQDFMGNVLRRKNGSWVKDIFVQIARLDGWMSTVVY